MEIEKLKKNLEEAVRTTLKEEPSLLEIGGGVHEQALCHRIALYLEKLFPKYFVDCEYNRELDLGKKIEAEMSHISQSARGGCVCSGCKGSLSEEEKERDFRPDIVVHRRKNHKYNILIVELKKKVECQFDIARLKAATDPEGKFRYKLGAFVYFLKGEPKFRWFPEKDMIEKEE